MALIYIVEDDQNIHEIETYALRNAGFLIEGFVCAKDFYARLAVRVPDLILLDVMLPDEDGLSIVKKLRSMPKLKHIPVIMVTARTTELDKVKGLDIGADDYITKPFGIMELISRVKALLRRSKNMEEESFLRAADISIDGKKRAVYVGEQLCELTYKEYQLLFFLVQNKGIVLSRDVIMDRVWGADYSESRTVDMHIKTLRQKLGAGGKVIKTVRNVGYMLDAE